MDKNELVLFNKFSTELKTKKEYLFVLNELKEYVGKSILEIEPEDIKSFLKNLGNTSNTKKKKYHQLLSFYNFIESELTIPNPVKLIPVPKASKQIKRERTLEFKEMKLLLDTLYSKFSFRDYLITLIIVTTGLKISEVLNIKFSDFFIDDNEHIGVKVGGANNERYVRIFDFVWKEIDKYRKELDIPNFYLKEKYFVFFSERKIKEYLEYPSIVKPLSSDWMKKVYTKACEAAGLPLITSKDIRHNYTMLCMKLGYPSEDIKDHLGWSNKEVIYRYHGVVELLDSPINKRVEGYYKELLEI
ncbi:MAG: site-specific integrase [Bacilli bacterium]|nr:site-specific integrase [Bacilli bacterium]